MVLLLAPLLELSECRMISDLCFSVSVLSCRLYRHHLENKIKLNNHQMAPPSHFHLNGFTIRCQAVIILWFHLYSDRCHKHIKLFMFLE